MALLPNYETWKNGSEADAKRIARDNLRNYPHIAVEHFKRRLDALFETVFKEKFCYSDKQVRFEFQGRGSIHAHFFLWINDLPPITAKLEDGRADELAQRQGIHISAINPDTERQFAPSIRGAIHSSSSEIDNTLEFLSDVLNRVQKHKCNSYCLRRRNGQALEDTNLYCRFHFPKEFRTVASVSKSENLKFFTFSAARNDHYLNAYNPLFSMAWRANTDFTPCTSAKAVLHYISKYCTKAEVSTQSFNDLIRIVITRVSDNRPVVSLFIRLLNKLVIERDQTAQEVCYILLDNFLVESSRTVTPINLRPPLEQQVTIQLDEIGDHEPSTKSVGRSVMTKYTERALTPNAVSGIKLVSLVQYIRTFNTRVGEPTRLVRGKERVIRVLNRYIGDPNHETWFDFCRSKIVLHVPWTEYPTLPFRFRGDNPSICYKNWEDAYFRLKDDFFSRPDRYPFFLSDGLQDQTLDPREDVESEFEDGIEDETEGVEEAEANELFLQGRENANRENSELASLRARLGTRPIDINADWTPFCGKYSDVYPDLYNPSANVEFWKALKERSDNTLEVATIASDTRQTLNREQRALYNLVYDDYISRMQSPNPRDFGQLLINVDSEAGTGKSFLITMLSSHLQRQRSRLDRDATSGPILRAAPTGVAASNIEGYTLHTALKLPLSNNSGFVPLGTNAIKELRERFRSIFYLIIDEKSMIGLNTLA